MQMWAILTHKARVLMSWKDPSLFPSQRTCYTPLLTFSPWNHRTARGMVVSVAWMGPLQHLSMCQCYWRLPGSTANAKLNVSCSEDGWLPPLKELRESHS